MQRVSRWPEVGFRGVTRRLLFINNYSELRLVHLFFLRILHAYIALEILKENVCHHRDCLVYIGYSLLGRVQMQG